MTPSDTLQNGTADPAPHIRAGSLLLTLLLLAAAIAFFEITDADLPVQDLFFNFETKTWMMPSHSDSLWADVIFYTGPKVMIISLGVLLILLTLVPAGILRIFVDWDRADMAIVILTLITAPLLIGFIKRQTNIHYPCNIERYGGVVPYVRLFETFPEDRRPAHRSSGFPGGHCSGGFALMSLVALARSRRGRLLALSAGMALGWWMGMYQMLRGVHYLSHTVVSMLICWAVFLVWQKIIRHHFPSPPRS